MPRREKDVSSLIFFLFYEETAERGNSMCVLVRRHFMWSNGQIRLPEVSLAGNPKMSATSSSIIPSFRLTRREATTRPE
jgi:hypothetical protein